MMYNGKHRYRLSEQAMKTTSSSKKPQRRRGQRGKEGKATLPADVVHGN
jgi:hypothetical protein